MRRTLQDVAGLAILRAGAMTDFARLRAVPAAVIGRVGQDDALAAGERVRLDQLPARRIRPPRVDSRLERARRNGENDRDIAAGVSSKSRPEEFRNPPGNDVEPRVPDF